jgi:hypothetical protein
MSFIFSFSIFAFTSEMNRSLNRTIKKLGYFKNVRALSENATQEMAQEEPFKKRPHVPVMLNEVIENLVTSNGPQVWHFHFKILKN